MRARLLLVVAVIATAAVAAAAGRELLGSDDDDHAPLRAGAYAGLTAQRLPIRLTSTADAKRLTLDVGWVHRCGSEVNRTVRRRAVKVADDGSFSFRQLHVVPRVDGDEVRQLLRLRGRGRSDGTLTGAWSAQVTQVNGQQVEHGGPGASAAWPRMPTASGSAKRWTTSTTACCCASTRAQASVQPSCHSQQSRRTWPSAPAACGWPTPSRARSSASGRDHRSPALAHPAAQHGLGGTCGGPPAKANHAR